VQLAENIIYEDGLARARASRYVQAAGGLRLQMASNELDNARALLLTAEQRLGQRRAVEDGPNVVAREGQAAVDGTTRVDRRSARQILW